MKKSNQYLQKKIIKSIQRTIWKIRRAFEPVGASLPSREEVFGSNMFYANEGGLFEMVKGYNTGGINYLPSKTDHDENDVNNYVRAEGYVEDGGGNGNKDEDTMLAQLGDGEFVSSRCSIRVLVFYLEEILKVIRA